MNPPFVPFAAALTQAAPAAGAAAPPPFAPMAVPAPNPAHAHPGGEPKITLERDGEVIKLIRIQCSCGQTVELACSY